MDLILWRNAEAEAGSPDLERRLTPKGQRHAVNVAAWLDLRLPARYTLLVSPATRAQQTAMALGIPVLAERQLAPGASADQILELAGWPGHKGTVVLVGHQPDLGAVIGRLLDKGGHWSIKKGGLWWLSNRVRNDSAQVVVRSVVAPDLI